MLVDLLKPVTIQRAEAVAKKMRTIETDPSNGILPLPKDAASFRIPASPVPEMIVDFKVKYPGQPNMPVEPARLRDLPELRQDPRLHPNASSGNSPNAATYWRKMNLTTREHEEIRRVMQRDKWADREITFVVERFSQAALLYAIDYHRKRVLGSRENLNFLRGEMSHILDRLKLSREELSAFVALSNHDRAWIARLMTARATAPQQSAEANQRKLDAIEEKLLERDLMTAQEHRMQETQRHLAAYAAATAHQIFKKSG